MSIAMNQETYEQELAEQRERYNAIMAAFLLQDGGALFESEGIDSLTNQPVYRQIQLTPCVGTPMP